MEKGAEQKKKPVGDKRGYEAEVETTETEYSEKDGLKGGLKFRGKPPPKIRKDSLEEQKQKIMTRNLPFKIEVKNDTMYNRVMRTLLMLLMFISIILAGHIYCVIFILILNICAFLEILSLKRDREKEIQFPYFYFVNWYFFGVGVFFFYGKLFSSKLTKFVIENPAINFIVAYHNLICFLMWCLGFLLYVVSLKRGSYRYQFRQFGWGHLSILLVVAQTSTIIYNVYEGLIWFIFPSLLVIVNDIFAYLIGHFFGRTRLIDLSPKKTWEGLIGGFFFTIIFCIVFGDILTRFQNLICPQLEFTFMPFQFSTCVPHKVFDRFSIDLPDIFSHIGLSSFTFSKFQLHSISLSCFASLISPFGGFFASGFKKAIRGKNVHETTPSTPAQTGILDRMDCQFLMGMFSYLYIHQVILARFSASNFSHILRMLEPQDQLALYKELQDMLVSQNLIANQTVARLV